MNGPRAILLVAALVSVAACKGKDDEETKAAAPIPPPTATPAPTPVTPTPLQPEVPEVKIEARVRAELDNRADGITGAPLAVAGAKASMQSPTGWQTTKGEFTVVASADKKSQLAARSFTPAESAASKLPAAATALGLTSCNWNPGENLSVGKSKLPASAADGLCTRGTAQVRAAYVAPTAEGLLVVGAWDADGDANAVFGSMRSINKAAGGDASGIAACCQALRQNAKSAPPEQQGGYIVAAGICEALKNDPNGRAALGQVRAALGGAGAPASCR
jgi:hypothetical protein